MAAELVVSVKSGCTGADGRVTLPRLGWGSKGGDIAAKFFSKFLCKERQKRGLKGNPRVISE